ncbi:DUF748 domain-containing protein [Pseudozobellia thermophila]|uniref:DUF748 domain-containing protein n=1 Tax=Pseudozobellia thermophila TaxID=192903 RepID=A0A1M6BCX2_9FLAO|nr:DUF748 domain-containing protein [Pseudozobellia thermophila]SHI46418.1 protein of unknown function [Pseudozobellia thermophila]
MKRKEKRGIRKKRYVLPLLGITLLIVLRLMLPFMVKNYVNGVLAELPGYHGHVADIDISLLRGAYVIHGLYLNKVDAGSEVPFLDLEKTDISIEWKALFNGKVVSEIVMTRPRFIYVFEDHQNDSAADPDIADWTKALTDLVPIAINNLSITDGKAAFVQLNADPNIDLHLNKIELRATNLRNVVRTEEELPSQIRATAVSIGQGRFNLEGKMDLVRQVPDMDVSFSLEEASATALNDFTRHYAGIDFVGGRLNVFGEMAIANDYLTGYIKPLLQDLKLVDPEQDRFLNILWEGFVGFFKFIVKNKGNNTVATKVPLKGDVSQVESEVWPTIWNLFKNGWIKAFRGVVDNDIDYKDAKEGARDGE